MTLASIKNDITKAGDSIDSLQNYLNENFSELQLFFLNLSETDCSGIETELTDFYYSFVNTNALQRLKNSDEKIPKEITAFLISIAKVFEKVRSLAVISDITGLLPPQSSIKYRFKALSKYWEGRANMNGYFTRAFPRVMRFLSKAQDADGEDYTVEVVIAVNLFYKEATAFFTSAEKTDKIESFKALFKNESNQKEFGFLRHYLIERTLEGIEFEGISLSEKVSKVYNPSEIMYRFFKDNIVDKVKYHQNTTDRKPLGFNNNEIRNDIIKYGRADFRGKYKSLSTDEIVLLYCYFNMRKHYFSTLHFFSKIQNFSDRISGENPIIFIDLGCGPLTSGLAIGDFFYAQKQDKLTLQYFGVDIAESMLKKAEEFSKHEIFNEESEWFFAENWNDILETVTEKIIPLKSKIIINASYLFASDSMDELDLATFVNNINESFPNNETMFFFQNPVNPARNSKFHKFKKQLKYLKNVQQFDEKVFYNTFPNSQYEPKKEIVYFEILTNH